MTRTTTTHSAPTTAPGGTWTHPMDHVQRRRWAGGSPAAATEGRRR